MSQGAEKRAGLEKDAKALSVEALEATSAAEGALEAFLGMWEARDEAVKKQAAEGLAAAQKLLRTHRFLLEEQQEAAEASGNVPPKGLTDIDVKMTVRDHS